jgi:hypothetical protein
MRYEPHSYEYAAVATMDDAALLEFFLTRIYETEEVWGLKECGAFWMSYERNGEETLPVFAYKLFAEEACVNDWEVMVPVAESIEFFMEESLPRMIQDSVVLEVMPRKEGRGSLVTAEQLYNILENMIENGTYTLDG